MCANPVQQIALPYQKQKLFIWNFNTPTIRKLFFANCPAFSKLRLTVHHKNVTVANVFDSLRLNIGFRRTLSGNKWDRWLH
jgi:hypothetical protein